MKVALGQMSIISGSCEENFMQLKTMVEEAQKKGADIIVFPEMCISGYLLGDLWLDDDFCEYIHSFNERIKELSEGIGIVFGNLYFQPVFNVKTARNGLKCRFNSVLFAYNNTWVKKENSTLEGIHIKHHNPDYGLFDDSRYFVSGQELQSSIPKENLIAPFLFAKGDCVYRIGLENCEDIWHAEVSDQYVRQDIDFICISCNSSWTLHKEKQRDKNIKEHFERLQEKMPAMIVVNACGMQNSGKNIIVFDGDSAVYDTQGERVFELNDNFQSEVQVYDFASIRLVPKCENKLLEALNCAIVEVDKQLFNASLKWIIGLSGGIDSSINAALLVKALGPKRVIGYNLASTYNSQTTKNNARILAESLDIELREGSIEALNQATIQTMKQYGYDKQYTSLVHENIQARVRGHLLSTFASIEGGVVINNANKVEVALGYCTLYGDAIGAFAPIGDLNKIECFELARALNQHFGKEVISNTLIPEVNENDIKWEMPPSAELKEAQLDPMKWYYHDVIIEMLMDEPTSKIEAFMQQFLDDSIYETPLGKWIHYYHLESGQAFIEDLEWLLSTKAKAAFKRIQMPPIVAVSKGAFGNERRESQLGFIKTQNYETLKTKILKIR